MCEVGVELVAYWLDAERGVTAEFTVVFGCCAFFGGTGGEGTGEGGAVGGEWEVVACAGVVVWVF